MTPAQTDETRVDIMTCPFCGGADYRIEPGGQTWRGVKGYSAPQYFHFYHNGVVPEGDGFQSCAIQIRARTETECTSIWNSRALERAAMQPSVAAIGDMYVCPDDDTALNHLEASYGSDLRCAVSCMLDALRTLSKETPDA